MPFDQAGKAQGRPRSGDRMSPNFESGSVAEHLIRVAGGVVAITVGLLFAVHVISHLVPQLLEIAVFVTIIVGGVAVLRYRRSHW